MAERKFTDVMTVTIRVEGATPGEVRRKLADKLVDVKCSLLEVVGDDIEVANGSDNDSTGHASYKIEKEASV